MSTGLWTFICIIGLVSLGIMLVALAHDDWTEKIFCFILGLVFYTLTVFTVSIEAVGRGNPQTSLGVGYYNVVLCRRVDTTVGEKISAFHDCWVNKRGDSQNDRNVKWLRIEKEADKSWSDLRTFAPSSEIEVFQYNDEVRVHGTNRVN